MSDRAAAKGDYVDLRFVKSRKVAQIVVEIPIEKAADFVAAFGAPNPATGVPVALARMDETRKQPVKERQRWSEIPPAKQAAIRCNEPDFQKYMGATNADHCAAVVRSQCKVQSRSDLNTDSRAAECWRAIEAEYFAWQRGGIR